MTEDVRGALRASTAGLVEREALAELIVLAAVAREHLLVIGPPGTAKSEAVRRVAAAFGGTTFEYLLGRFTEPSEIFGPVDLKKLRDGVVETRTEGMLPEAELAFLDEVLLGSTAILNTLLGLLNDRVFRRGHTVVDCPLRVCVGASNALPDDPGLEAFADCFLLRVFVEPLGDPRLEELLEGGWVAERPTIEALPLARLDELADQANTMDLAPVRAELAAAVRTLRGGGILLSDRRVVKIQKLAAVAAALAGREHPTAPHRVGAGRRGADGVLPPRRLPRAAVPPPPVPRAGGDPSIRGAPGRGAVPARSPPTGPDGGAGGVCPAGGSRAGRSVVGRAAGPPPPAAPVRPRRLGGSGGGPHAPRRRGVRPRGVGGRGRRGRSPRGPLAGRLGVGPPGRAVAGPGPRVVPGRGVRPRAPLRAGARGSSDRAPHRRSRAGRPRAPRGRAPAAPAIGRDGASAGPLWPSLLPGRSPVAGRPGRGRPAPPRRLPRARQQLLRAPRPAAFDRVGSGRSAPGGHVRAEAHLHRGPAGGPADGGRAPPQRGGEGAGVHRPDRSPAVARPSEAPTDADATLQPQLPRGVRGLLRVGGEGALELLDAGGAAGGARCSEAGMGGRAQRRGRGVGVDQVDQRRRDLGERGRRREHRRR